MLVLTQKRLKSRRQRLVYYVGPWQWRDECWNPPQSCVGALDLRSNPQCGLRALPAGFGLFVLPDYVRLPSEYESFGSNLVQAQPSQCQRRFASMLGCGRSGNDLESMVWGAITVHADPTGESRCRPIVPTVEGDFELWLSGQRVRAKRFRFDDPEATPVQDLLRRAYRQHRLDSLEGRAPANLYKKILGYWCWKYGVSYRWFQPADVPDEEPVAPETTITESFPTTGTDISTGQDQPWTELAGNHTVATGGKLRAATGGVLSASRCDTALSSSDNEAECVYSDTSTTTTRYAGPICRYDGSADSGYFGGQAGGASSAGLLTIFKRVTGTNTALGTPTSQTQAATKKISANGTTIAVYQNGVSVESLTDSSLSSGVRFGAMHISPSTTLQSLASFVASDLGGGGGATPKNVFGKMLSGPFGGAI